MINTNLYKRELKGNLKMLIIFIGILALYISMTIPMYDPKMQETLNQMSEVMPGLMDAMGFKAGDTTLIGFLSSYLYGFILTAFPMVFTILCSSKLIARYVDRGSMVNLLAAPVKRHVIAITQAKVLITGILVMVLFSTLNEIILCESSFSGELDMGKFLILNLGLLGLHLFIGGICFFFSCLCSDMKNTIALGAGIPTFMFVLQMLANIGGNLEKIKYITFFSLFNPEGIISNDSGAIVGIIVLFVGAVLLFTGAVVIFSKKDLHI